MEERLQKWIARCGISSRRAAEELLRQGRVTLNGRVAGLGESGDPERDTLLVDGRPVAAGTGAGVSDAEQAQRVRHHPFRRAGPQNGGGTGGGLRPESVPRGTAG